MQPALGRSRSSMISHLKRYHPEQDEIKDFMSLQDKRKAAQDTISLGSTREFVICAFVRDLKDPAAFDGSHMRCWMDQTFKQRLPEIAVLRDNFKSVTVFICFWVASWHDRSGLFSPLWSETKLFCVCLFVVIHVSIRPARYHHHPSPYVLELGCVFGAYWQCWECRGCDWSVRSVWVVFSSFVKTAAALFSSLCHETSFVGNFVQGASKHPLTSSVGSQG